MLNVLGIWILLLGILLGWGLLVLWLLRRVVGRLASGALGAFQTIWLGYAGLQAFLQLASFVLATNTLTFALSCGPAIAGYALQRDHVRRRWCELRLRPHVAITGAVVVLLAAIVVVYAASDHVVVYDTGLYHLQAVKWMAHYPVVPGLGNLHVRLGYNNSVHLFGAYTDALWEGMAAHLANGVLLAVALGQWFVEILGARTPRGRVRQAYCLLTLPLLLLELWGGEVSSLSTDLPLTIFAAVCLLELVSLPRTSRLFLPLTLVLAIAAVATTTKLGGLALLVVTSVVAVLLIRRIVVFALPALLVAGWIARGIVLSGWLLYPAFGHLPVSWAVSHHDAAWDFDNIQSWARMPQTPSDIMASHDFWWWFGPWLKNFSGSHEFLLLVAAIAILAWRCASGAPRAAMRAAGAWGALAACLLGITEWMTGAPSLRYGGLWFWILLAAVATPFVAELATDRRVRTVVIGLAFAFCAWSGGFNFHETATVPRLWGRLPAPQRATTKRVVTGPDTEVLTPAGDDDRCFDEPLPCTPQTGIGRVRDPSDIGAGYVSSNPDAR